jgi:hypothetical protein
MLRFCGKNGCTLSAEKFFCIRSGTFLFAFWVLLLVLYGVSGSVFAVLACASMLFSVTFNVGMRDVWMLQRALGESEFRKKKKGSIALGLLQLCWDCCSGSFEQLFLNMQAQSVCSRCDFS